MALSMYQQCLLPLMNFTIHLRRMQSYIDSEMVLESAQNARPLRCYKEEISKVVRNFNGQERECNWFIVVFEEVTQEDFIVLPGFPLDDEENIKRAWTIEKFDDPNTGKPSHWELYL